MQQPTKPGAKRAISEWSASEDACWKEGSLHQVHAEGKRLRQPWREQTRTLEALHREHKHRVDQCWQQSVGVQVCNELADQLHRAMKEAPIEDLRLSVAGEKHRILTRALAMREVMRAMDSTLAAQQVRNDGGHGGSRCMVTPSGHHHQQQGGRVVTMQRSSNEMEPDALPDQCLLSVCLLMAALYEQTPWGEGSEVRKMVYQDFTMLKRHFRQDELQMMAGKTGTTEELFGCLKSLDRAKGVQNLVGILFEDWKVHARVDAFILSDLLDVEVLTLTSDGPIGKFKCKLRTLMTLSLLHQRLVKELYAAVFADRPAPNKQCDMMTAADPLDFIDFTEALGRNIPHKVVEGTNLYYAWMYAPEVHAPPEVWQQVFGPGASSLPTLYDGVQTPDDVVCITNKDGDYALDLAATHKHDFRSQASAQAAVGFPWSDDLIGAYLRKLRESPYPPHLQPHAASGATSSSGSVGTTPAAAAGLAQPAPAQPAVQSPAGQLHSSAAQGPAVKQEAEEQEGPLCPSGKLELSMRQSWTLKPRQKGTAARGKQAAAKAEQLRRAEVARIPNADETGQLALPLGIFMVGIICSGAFTNTQVHVEDLLLMSVNINMFGAPKIWWWIPQESVQAFKDAAELMTEGGRGELYTKSISPFLTDRETGQPEHVLPLDRLRELGAKRTIQMPGMGIWTMPGYAFHFTVSMGLNVAESANMFLEVMGWTFEKLWMARPLEQYPEPEDDMSRFMRETGLLQRLGVPDRPPLDAVEVHRTLAPRLRPGTVKCTDGQQLKRAVYHECVKYCTLDSESSHSSQQTATTVVETSQVQMVGRKRRAATATRVAAIMQLPTSSSSPDEDSARHQQPYQQPQQPQQQQEEPVAALLQHSTYTATMTGLGSEQAPQEAVAQVVLPQDLLSELAEFAKALPGLPDQPQPMILA